MLIRPYAESRKIPFINEDLNILRNGDILDCNGNPVTLEEFRLKTGINVYDQWTLVIVAHQFFNWASVYWPHIRAVCKMENDYSPESLLATILEPVEALDYPGYYLIPYYSQYLITKTGTLLKRSYPYYIKGSKATTGYYTYRMEDDFRNTQNRLRHRILGMAFLPYTKNLEYTQINHINGIKGDDRLENLEWVTHAENIQHAAALGLLATSSIEVQARDAFTGRVYIFESFSAAGRYFGVEPFTINIRCRSKGEKSYDGIQFRYHPDNTEWPAIDPSAGRYKVVYPNGDVKWSSCKGAARLAGVTRTSLQRMLREGRHLGLTGVSVYKPEDRGPAQL
jgi:KaiC/GvpD/RAD55 family RecA-like ATPase